ncbi:MAG: LysR family transcriptional regulator [Gammaproteobacteria bacterium]|nr:LysR family transcriptional regulator [Gammaproteobacteria bacterium]
MIDKNAMALYVKVVENNSFSRTAQREDVPVSTVSRKISELEKALGVRLLERSTRRLRMTEIGQDYYQRCRRGLDEFETANLMVSDQQANVSGRLRLSVPPSLSDAVVMPLIEAFQALYPNATVNCLVTDRHVNHIEDGIDISFRVGDLIDSSLVARRLLNYRSVLVASPGYLQRAGAPAHPNELSLHGLVAFSRWQPAVTWILENNGETYKVNVQPRIAINDYAGVQSAVIKGLGISEIPQILCGPGLQDGRLVEVMPEWKFSPVTLSAVYPSNRNLSRLVRLFKDFCVERIQGLAPHAKIT